jgi:hypothetical protein
VAYDNHRHSRIYRTNILQDIKPAEGKTLIAFRNPREMALIALGKNCINSVHVHTKHTTNPEPSQLMMRFIFNLKKKKD